MPDIMRSILLICVILYAAGFLKSQTPVGLKRDLSGQPFNGYYDPLTYSPARKIESTFSNYYYEAGYYFDAVGNKQEGLIKIEGNKVIYKRKDHYDKSNLVPDQVTGFVAGADSFFCVTAINRNNKIKHNPEFVHYIGQYAQYVLARHSYSSAEMAQIYLDKPSIVETYLIKSKDSAVWASFSDNKKFKEQALTYFGDCPVIHKKIETGAYSYKDLNTIFKMADYYRKYQAKELIFYDRYWKEVRFLTRDGYSAKITNLVDSIWTLDYYQGSNKLYQANYSCLFPVIKNGDFTSYYPDGKVRKIEQFTNNELLETKTFDTKGLMTCHYKIIETKNETSEKKPKELQFISINDSLGNNLPIHDQMCKTQTFDSFENTSYTCIYSSDKVVSCYRLLEKDTVFQITKPEEVVIYKLQSRFGGFMRDKSLEEALAANAEGIVLVSMIIDDKGFVIKSELLNRLHPQIDNLIENFLSENLLVGAESRFRFVPFKKNKSKRYCEVTVPFKFSTNRIFYPKMNPFYMNDYGWRQSMYHMEMQQNLRNMASPSPFRGF